MAILAVLVEVLQGAARVPVAGGGAAVPGDADVPDHNRVTLLISSVCLWVPVVDVDGEGEGAHGVGDGVHGRVPQHRRDPVSVVSGLAPARDLHETCNICNMYYIVLYCTAPACPGGTRWSSTPSMRAGRWAAPGLGTHTM